MSFLEVPSFILSRDGALLMLRVILGTKSTWLGLRKDHIVAGNTKFWCNKQAGDVPWFCENIVKCTLKLCPLAWQPSNVAETVIVSRYFAEMWPVTCAKMNTSAVSKSVNCQHFVLATALINDQFHLFCLAFHYSEKITLLYCWTSLLLSWWSAA